MLLCCGYLKIEAIKSVNSLIKKTRGIMQATKQSYASAVEARNATGTLHTRFSDKLNYLSFYKADELHQFEYEQALQELLGPKRPGYSHIWYHICGLWDVWVDGLRHLGVMVFSNWRHTRLLVIALQCCRSHWYWLSNNTVMMQAWQWKSCTFGARVVSISAASC